MDEMPPPPPPAGAPVFAPPQPAEPSRAFASWALGLSFFPFLCGTGVVSFVFATIVLVRSRDGRNHGKGRAIAALVILALWFVGLVAAVIVSIAQEADRAPGGDITNRGTVSINDVRKGDCLQRPKVHGGGASPIYSVDAVPCSESHDAEAYASFDLADGPFPGGAKVSRSAEAGCLQRFRGFIGKSYDRTRLSVIFVHPVAASWDTGDRQVTCIVTVPRGHTVTGTLRGSRR